MVNFQRIKKLLKRMKKYILNQNNQKRKLFKFGKIPETTFQKLESL